MLRIINLGIIAFVCLLPVVSCAVPPTGTFASVGADTTARFFHRASLLPNGRVMVSGGMRLQVFPSVSLVSLRDMSFFDPVANVFSATYTLPGGGSSMPRLATARSSHTQTTLADGRVLITGGHIGASGSNPGTPTDSVELFDPASGAMLSGPPMSLPRAGHAAVLMPNGQVVVSGGTTWQVFDPAAAQWSAALPLRHSRVSHAAVLIPNAFGLSQPGVLLIGGGGSGPATMEMLDPDSGSSTLSQSTLTIGVDDVAAVRLDDGTVFICGGQAYDAVGDTVSLAYVYDPASDTLAPAAPVAGRPAGIADHQLIGVGQFALIFGGEQQLAGQDTELAHAGIFDAAANAWPFVGNSISAHDDAASARLPDGRVLLIGGGVPFLGNELPSNLAEVFTPQLVRRGDANGDGTVDSGDVPVLVTVLMNPDSATPDERCAADANGDGALDGMDAALLAWVLAGGG